MRTYKRLDKALKASLRDSIKLIEYSVVRLMVSLRKPSVGLNHNGCKYLSGVYNLRKKLMDG